MTCCVRPPRSNRQSTSRLARGARTVKKRSQFGVSIPPTARTRSPGCSPAFLAAESSITVTEHDRFGVVEGDARALVDDDREQDDGENEVHDRAHDQDLEPLPLALRQEFVGRAGALVLGGFAGHLDVAAERDGADAVLGVAALEGEQFRPEAERESQDADADPARHQEMSELVHEDQHAEHEHEGENRRHVSLSRSPHSGGRARKTAGVAAGRFDFRSCRGSV